METESLTAFTRQRSGKGPARRLRGAGQVPAILYGPKTEPLRLSVNARALKKILSQEGEQKFINLLIDDDGGKGERLALVKSVQIHPLKRNIIHADFYQIDMDSKITVEVPIRVTGSSPGVAIGGELQLMKRSVRVSCLPSLMPNHLDADISSLGVGDSLKIKDLIVGEGINVQEGEDVTVVYIAPTRATMKASE
ncbi:MAG: 50S ribosomal protein L25 [Syntrophales bacterium]|nr:50S ribosomal protein L25 [Syntrophales bacterium]